MKNIFFILLLLTGFIYPEVGRSQIPVDSSKIYFQDYKFFDGYVQANELSADTLFEYVFFYDLLKQNILSSPRTGNPGSASLNVFGKDNAGKIISDGFDQFEPYLLKPLRRFPSNFTERRASSINYHLGSKKEQHIFISHEQKIRPWMMAGLDFGAMASTGDFSRQLNKNRNLDIWFAYQAPSDVYRAYISFTSNRVENQENGGISADSVFENASSLDTRTLPVNLDNALMIHKTRDYLLKQELNLSKLFSKKDTSKKSSAFEDGSLILSHAVWWSRKSVLFTSENPDSGYFANTYLDTVATFDSSFYNDIYNQALLEYTSPTTSSGNSFSIGAGVNFQMVDYFTSGLDSNFNSLMAIAIAGFRSKKFSSDISYSKALSGDFNNSYHVGLSMSYLINEKGDKAALNLSASSSPQSLRDRIYISNHFIWNNRFNLEERYEASVGFEWSEYKIGLTARTVSARNMVYYRENYLPQTFSDFVSFSEIELLKKFSFGKFGMDDKLIFGFSGNEDVVRLPAASVYASFYYANLLFKNALGFKAGIDVYWNSSYQGYGYMPATGIFYLQDEKSIGNYPTAAVFVAMKIKTANLFFRLDHLNAGLSERTYYGAYHYPLPGRTFKFGVKWNLFD